MSPLSILLPATPPDPARRRVSVRVTRDAQRQIRSGHPWLFDASITGVSHDGECGDLAVVFDDKRRFLAIGLYDPASPIRVRLLHHGSPRTIDSSFWSDQLAVALARRQGLASLTEAELPATTAYRCVHGENDQLPGLVVDRYDHSYVVKLDTPAWLPHLPDVIEALLGTVGHPVERVVLRFSRSATAEAAKAGLADGAVVAGAALERPVRFRENGLVLEADLAHGQKTGHFLDQRDNRARVARLSAGARVLDVFSCSGGFALNAAAGGASAVHCVDASPHAIAAAAHHFDLNRHRPEVAACALSSSVGDAFTVLAGQAGRRQQYEVVVVDPPSFASKASDEARALAAYGRLTVAALAVLAPGGVLVQSSCSSRVPAKRFFDGVGRSAAAAGRPLQELERTGHPDDHPVGFPQGAYLKTLLARVP